MLWAIADGTAEQVGCIHTCQGLEFDYVGVIIGDDFTIRDGRVVTDAGKRAGQDRSVHGYKTMLKKIQSMLVDRRTRSSRTLSHDDDARSEGLLRLCLGSLNPRVRRSLRPHSSSGRATGRV